MKFKGKITTTGTSEAIRLEKDLFKRHPEFKQQAEVTAQVIGPGKMLISVLNNPNEKSDDEDDPIVGAFLAFLENDLCNNLAALTPVDADVMARAKALTAGMKIIDEDLE